MYDETKTQTFPIWDTTAVTMREWYPKLDPNNDMTREGWFGYRDKAFPPGTLFRTSCPAGYKTVEVEGSNSLRDTSTGDVYPDLKTVSRAAGNPSGTHPRWEVNFLTRWVWMPLDKLTEPKKRPVLPLAEETGFTMHGITFKAGTRFRGKTNGSYVYAEAKAGRFVFQNHWYSSSSAAATQARGCYTNGRNFWEQWDEETQAWIPLRVMVLPQARFARKTKESPHPMETEPSNHQRKWEHDVFFLVETALLLWRDGHIKIADSTPSEQAARIRHIVGKDTEQLLQLRDAKQGRQMAAKALAIITNFAIGLETKVLRMNPDFLLVFRRFAKTLSGSAHGFCLSEKYCHFLPEGTQAEAWRIERWPHGNPNQ